jgi:hypothetical protein
MNKLIYKTISLFIQFFKDITINSKLKDNKKICQYLTANIFKR